MKLFKLQLGKTKFYIGRKQISDETALNLVTIWSLTIALVVVLIYSLAARVEIHREAHATQMEMESEYQIQQMLSARRSQIQLKGKSIDGDNSEHHGEELK